MPCGYFNIKSSLFLLLQKYQSKEKIEQKQTTGVSAAFLVSYMQHSNYFPTKYVQ